MFAWFCRLISVVILLVLMVIAAFASAAAPANVKEALYYLALSLFVLSFLWPMPVAVSAPHP